MVTSMLQCILDVVKSRPYERLTVFNSGNLFCKISRPRSNDREEGNASFYTASQDIGGIIGRYSLIAISTKSIIQRQ